MLTWRYWKQPFKTIAKQHFVVSQYNDSKASSSQKQVFSIKWTIAWICVSSLPKSLTVWFDSFRTTMENLLHWVQQLVRVIFFNELLQISEETATCCMQCTYLASLLSPFSFLSLISSCLSGGAAGVHQPSQSQVSDRCLHPYQQTREHTAGHGFPQFRKVCVT